MVMLERYQCVKGAVDDMKPAHSTAVVLNIHRGPPVNTPKQTWLRHVDVIHNSKPGSAIKWVRQDVAARIKSCGCDLSLNDEGSFL